MRIINASLGIALLLYIIVWLGCVMNWFVYEKEVYAIGSSFVVFTFLLNYLLSSNIGGKNTLLLIITVTYLTFTSLAKFKLQGLTVFPIIILVSTATLLLLELYDWIKGKPKSQKMNLIQLFCLISFFVMLIFKIQHYSGGVVSMILFHLGLIGVAIELMINKRNVT
ncbi:MAG: hypothetical protein WED10_11675 [Brumimicrobium sp.]